MNTPASLLLEELAAIVERDEDYRVLRRIVPIREMPEALTEGLGRVDIIDTETTSTDPETCELTEIAILPVYFDKISYAVLGTGSLYHSFNETKEPIPPEITELTGISDADVFGQAIDQEAIKVKLAGADFVAAHNAAFDRPIVERYVPALQRMEIPWACTMSEIPWKQMGAVSLSLGGIAAGLGFFFDAHRAENDLHALAHLLSLSYLPGGDTFLSMLVKSKDTTRFRVWADNSHFDVKDKLKARGYKWRQQIKTWYRDVEDAQAEAAWLTESRYCRNPRVEALPATERYRHG